jgi:xylulokinase
LKYLLGIDIGTSGTKSTLVDIQGLEITSSLVEYPLYQPQIGWAEQDPNDWWNATRETCKKILSQSGINPRDIAGIGLTGQMHGLVMLDEKGEVLRRSIIWCDQRTENECKQITSVVGREKLLDITANPSITGFTASKILWVRNHEPDLFSKCKKILLPKDYIRYKLTGEFATDVSDASGMQLLDVKNRRWSQEVLNKLELDIELLAKVYESPEITGRITSPTSFQTGLLEGTPVVAGAGDNEAAAVGVGAVVDNKAFTTIGTSGVVFAHTKKMKFDPLGRVHTFCSAVPGEWHVMGVTQAAGLSLQWFKNNFCHEEIWRSTKEQLDPYEIMSEEASLIPIGSNKLIYLPYLMGERTPHLDPSCRGVFFGLSAMHTRMDLIRAVMEGVTFSLLDCVNIFREMDISFPEMLICGGGGRSHLWRSMISDNFNCKVKTLGSAEGPAFCCAILASVGVGIYDSVKDACNKMVMEKEIVEPDYSNNQEYMKYYEIYKRLYNSLRVDFKSLEILI